MSSLIWWPIDTNDRPVKTYIYYLWVPSYRDDVIQWMFGRNDGTNATVIIMVMIFLIYVKLFTLSTMLIAEIDSTIECVTRWAMVV